MPTVAVCSINLADLLGKLHAVHRAASIEIQKEAANLARRITEKRWPGLAPPDRRMRELQQQRRISRHFHRHRDAPLGPLEFAVNEIRKVSPDPFEARHLAEYAGRVNAGASLHHLPEDHRRLAALVGRLDREGFTMVLLDKLREKFPGVVEAMKVARAPKRQPKITKAEANVKARDYLKNKNPGDRLKVTARELADAVDCALGLVSELPAWRALEESRKQPAKAKQIRLSDNMLSVTGRSGQSHDALDALIAEQAADAEPSPLDDDPRSVKVHVSPGRSRRLQGNKINEDDP